MWRREVVARLSVLVNYFEPLSPELPIDYIRVHFYYVFNVNPGLGVTLKRWYTRVA